MWGEYAYSATTTLHFRSLAKGGVDFPFRSPVTPPAPPATAWQQARQPRIESSASIAGGTKTRVSQGSDKETFPSAPLVPTIKGKTVPIPAHPDSDFVFPARQTLSLFHSLPPPTNCQTSVLLGV